MKILLFLATPKKLFVVMFVISIFWKVKCFWFLRRNDKMQKKKKYFCDVCEKTVFIKPSKIGGVFVCKKCEWGKT